MKQHRRPGCRRAAWGLPVAADVEADVPVGVQVDAGHLLLGFDVAGLPGRDVPEHVQRHVHVPLAQGQVHVGDGDADLLRRAAELVDGILHDLGGLVLRRENPMDPPSAAKVGGSKWQHLKTSFRKLKAIPLLAPGPGNLLAPQHLTVFLWGTYGHVLYIPAFVKDVLILRRWVHTGLFELYLHYVCTHDYFNSYSLCPFWSFLP